MVKKISQIDFTEVYSRWRIVFADGSFAIVRRPAAETIFTLADRISRLNPCNRATVAVLNI